MIIVITINGLINAGIPLVLPIISQWYPGWWFGAIFMTFHIGHQHPNWRVVIFFRGVGRPPASIVYRVFFQFLWKSCVTDTTLIDVVNRCGILLFFCIWRLLQITLIVNGLSFTSQCSFGRLSTRLTLGERGGGGIYHPSPLDLIGHITSGSIHILSECDSNTTMVTVICSFHLIAISPIYGSYLRYIRPIFQGYVRGYVRGLCKGLCPQNLALYGTVASF